MLILLLSSKYCCFRLVCGLTRLALSPTASSRTVQRASRNRALASWLIAMASGRCPFLSCTMRQKILSYDYTVYWYNSKEYIVCVFSSHPFWTSSSLDVPAGVTQEEGHTGFLIHLPSAVRALIFVARRIQPFLSLVGREVECCVLTN